jgi:hypothetical protein
MNRSLVLVLALAFPPIVGCGAPDEQALGEGAGAVVQGPDAFPNPKDEQSRSTEWVRASAVTVGRPGKVTLVEARPSECRYRFDLEVDATKAVESARGLADINKGHVHAYELPDLRRFDRAVITTNSGFNAVKCVSDGAKLECQTPSPDPKAIWNEWGDNRENGAAPFDDWKRTYLTWAESFKARDGRDVPQEASYGPEYRAWISATRFRVPSEPPCAEDPMTYPVR